MNKRTSCKTALMSQSPFGEVYRLNEHADDSLKINKFIEQNKSRKTVVIQGMGFVGTAMLTAVASAKGKAETPLYAVMGIDLPTESAYWKIGMINDAKLPVKSSDNHFKNVFKEAFKSGNIMATADTCAYIVADIVIVSINLDVEKSEKIFPHKGKVSLDRFICAMREIARRIKPSCLVIVESTLPPGTCEKLLLPLFKAEFKKRKYNCDEVKLAYSYERVMPGKNYLKSITSYYRVYSGIGDGAKRETRKFLESIIDVDSYPLTELSNVTAVEIGKVLENSYRAMNIAFMQEWTELAEVAGVNLFEVIDGIKKRDTHNNIMLPGFGVGGYCLTKDPILADWGNIELFNREHHLSMGLNALDVNDNMPLHSFNLLKRHARGIKGKKILLMGISYLKDVADTRFSPSELFYKKCIKDGASVIPHDPIVTHWPEMDVNVVSDLHKIAKNSVDAIVFAVKHDEYMQMLPEEYEKLLKPGSTILDTGNIINDDKAALLRDMGFQTIGVGKGHWNKTLEG